MFNLKIACTDKHLAKRCLLMLCSRVLTGGPSWKLLSILLPAAHALRACAFSDASRTEDVPSAHVEHLDVVAGYCQGFPLCQRQTFDCQYCPLCESMSRCLVAFSSADDEHCQKRQGDEVLVWKFSARKSPTHTDKLKGDLIASRSSCQLKRLEHSELNSEKARYLDHLTGLR